MTTPNPQQGVPGPGAPQPGPYQQPVPPQGYPQAQPQGYPQGQPQGYPQGQPPYPGAPMQPPPPPPGYASSDDKTWALIAHFGGAAGNFVLGWLGWVAPLVAMLGRGATSPQVRAHAVAALNFQAPVAAVSIVLFILRIATGFSLIDVLLLLLSIAVWLFGAIFGILGGVKANEGTLYKYPLPFQFVK